MREIKQKMTAFLLEEMEKSHLPCIDVAVYHHHKEVYRYMAGVEDLKTRIPVSRQTLYHIYSNTKVITCTAALQLFEQGKFLLEDRLDRFYPELAHLKVKKPDGSLEELETPITIRDLFRMTAGFGGPELYTDLLVDAYAKNGGSYPLEELPGLLAQLPLEFQPGAHFRYGICHDVLGALIEKISGQKFSVYLKEHIFDPLGMRNTGFTVDDCQSGNIATQYGLEGPDKPLVDMGTDNVLMPPVFLESGGGGLISSVDDMMRFHEALCRGDVLLSKLTTHLMRLNQLSGPQLEDYFYNHIGMGYGLGVRTIVDQAKCGSPMGFGPFGWAGAAGTYSNVDPEHELVIFYAQQMFGNETDRMQHIIRNIAYAGI